MGDLFKLIWWAVVGLFRPRSALQAEILVLRHQLNVLRRRSPKRVAVSNIDRLVFTGLFRLAPDALDALKILKPETVIGWHRAGFRAWWRWKSRPRGGRPKTPAEVRRLICEMSLANPLWGAPRLHGELRKLGIDVGQTTVAKYMSKRRRPPHKAGRPFFTIMPRPLRRSTCLSCRRSRFGCCMDFSSCGMHPRACVAGRNNTSQCRMAGSSADRGLGLERTATLYHSRSRRRLWRCIPPAVWRDGHTGPTDLSAVAMAKRACRAAHRLDPAGVS